MADVYEVLERHSVWLEKMERTTQRRVPKDGGTLIFRDFNVNSPQEVDAYKKLTKLSRKKNHYGQP